MIYFPGSYIYLLNWLKLLCRNKQIALAQKASVKNTQKGLRKLLIKKQQQFAITMGLSLMSQKILNSKVCFMDGSHQLYFWLVSTD